MSAGEEEEEYELTRRETLLGGALLGGAAGATIWGALEIYKGLWDQGSRPHPDGRRRDKGDDNYHDDPDETTYKPGDTREEINSWEEALPGNCSLNEDEKEWLVGRLDRYDNLDQEDFFDYVGEEVRLEKRGTELRMEVDPDYSGNFNEEDGYNIEDAC